MIKSKIILGIFFTISSIVNAQVGIGVPNPKEMLEIDGGDVYINGKFYIDDLPSYDGVKLGPDQFRMVTIDRQSKSRGSSLNGKFMEFRGHQEIMPIIIQPYHITNVSKDNLKELNLNISSDKYVISLSNFEAIPMNGNEGIYRKGWYIDFFKIKYEYDNFIIRSFEKDGKWHVHIGAKDADPQIGHYEYSFDIILFPKRFFRNLGEITYDLKGKNSGAATAPPTGI